MKVKLEKKNDNREKPERFCHEGALVRVDLGVQSSLTMPLAGVLLLSTPHAVVAWGAERLRRPKANVENKSENSTPRCLFWVLSRHQQVLQSRWWHCMNDLSCWQLRCWTGCWVFGRGIQMNSSVDASLTRMRLLLSCVCIWRSY